MASGGQAGLVSRAIDLLDLDVGQCPRCDGHHMVHVKRFAKPLPPVTAGSVVGQQAAIMVFTYWGLCPTTREPILMTSAIEPELVRGIACVR